MSDESAVMEPQTETEVKERKYTPLTPEQKQAATLRRDASLLRKYGNEAKAKELEAEADALAPIQPKVTRVDPLVALSPQEQGALQNYFKTTKQGFAKIAEHISYKKLAEIAAGIDE